MSSFSEHSELSKTLDGMLPLANFVCWLALSRSDRHVVPLLLLRRANGLACVVAL